MNITEKIQTINNRVIQLKENFKTALQNKNVTVSDLLKLKDYPNLINEIKGSVTENIDLTNLTPENIRAGVTINGVTGTLVKQWDVVISPTEPENPHNGMIWIRDMSDESNNESGDDSSGGDSGGNDTGGSDSGGGTSNADYTVSGAGTEAANGDYVAYESSYTAYKHTTNDIYLWYDSNLVKWYICMTGPGTTGVAEVYYETAVDCPDPTTASWFTSTPAGSDPVPTVTKVGSSSSGGESEGYTITYFESIPNLQANYLKTTAPSWGDSSYTYYKHETMDIYLYTTGGSTVTRGFDAYGFTSDYWFSAFVQNPCDVVNFMDENSGVMFNATIVAYGGSDSGGGTSNADYIVSGSSTTEVNGDYINTGRISNDRPVYTNDTYYMRWYSGMWEITEEDENSNMKPPKHSVSSSDMTPPASGWYGGITVTSGGNESSTPADYIVSGAGTEAVNGNYYATGEYYEGRNSAPIYKNKNGVYFFATGSHNIFANSITTDLNIETYYHCEAYGDYYTTGAWANDALYPTCGEFGIEPFPTVTKA